MNIKDIDRIIRKTIHCYEHKGPCKRCDSQFACSMKYVALDLLWGGAY